MGYYIEGPAINKVKYLQDTFSADILPHAPTEGEFNRMKEEGMAVICVIQNNTFDAAAYAFSYQELRVFNNPNDMRPKTFMLMLAEDARRETKYNDK